MTKSKRRLFASLHLAGEDLLQGSKIAAGCGSDISNQFGVVLGQLPFKKSTGPGRFADPKQLEFAIKKA